MELLRCLSCVMAWLKKSICKDICVGGGLRNILILDHTQQITYVKYDIITILYIETFSCCE